MKQLLSLLSLILIITGCASSKKIVKKDYPNPFEFSLTDDAPGSKSDIYVRAYEWVTRSYISARTVVDMHDKEAGKIIGKAVLEFKDYPFGSVDYIFTIDAREGKYRIIFSNFRHKGGETTTRYGTRTGYGYGDLNKEKVIRRLPEGNVKKEDKFYYGLKNYVMEYSSKLLEDFQKNMKQEDSFK